MATRTYTNTDFINYIAGFTSNSGSNTAIATVFSNFNFVIAASGANTADPPNGLEDAAIYVYEASGDLDFALVPTLPEDALISEVEVKIDIAVSASAASSSTTVNPFPCYAGGVTRGKTFLGVVELTDLEFENINEDGPGTTPRSASVSDFDHYTAEQIFDFSGSPINKATFETDFLSWLVQLEMIWQGSADIGGPATGTSSETSGFTFTGIRITVTYEGGGMSMSPSSGNVEPGQSLTVTGPDADTLTYAAIIGDNVVPIIPKIISPEEVLLEVPYPPSDPCFDCFGDCPECEDCATACGEDIDGEDCQACMENCLECLTNCLESLALSEACQQTTQSDPEVPPVIVVVCGTQFGGTVTLGTLTVLVAEASGIYRFVDGKTNDTLYATARDGTTYDVKIPNPGAKTGFFRS